MLWCGDCASCLAPGPLSWRWGDHLAVGNSALAASCSQVPTAPAQVEATSLLLEGWESCSVCFSPSSGMRVLLGTNRARRLLPFALRKSEKPVPFVVTAEVTEGCSSRPATSPDLLRIYCEHSAVLLHQAAVIVVTRVIIRNPSHTNDPKRGGEVTIHCRV